MPPRGAVQAVGEDPAAEISEALRSLGPPGGVWGRLSVEEESPAGAWTPLDGIEVTLYPATPTLVAELERIRQSARGSATQYESAVARVQSALTVHQGRIDRQTAQPPTLGDLLVAEPPPVKQAPPKAALPASEAKPSRTAGSSWSTGGSRFQSSRTTPPLSAPAATSSKARQAKEEPDHPWRQKTDPAGLFAFPTVPSGDWLVVAVQGRAVRRREAPCRAEAPSVHQDAGVSPAGWPAREGSRALGDPDPRRQGGARGAGPHRPGALAGRADPLGV